MQETLNTRASYLKNRREPKGAYRNRTRVNDFAGSFIGVGFRLAMRFR